MIYSVNSALYRSFLSSGKAKKAAGLDQGAAGKTAGARDAGPDV